MKINWERILQNKYNHMLVTLVFILIAYPLLESSEGEFPIIPMLLLVAVAPALWVTLSRKVFIPVISLGVIAYAVNIYTHFSSRAFADETVLVLLFLYVIFYFLAIAILVMKISSNKVVTSDTIKGGISIYFLLGLFWALLYMILVTFDEDAISVPVRTDNVDVKKVVSAFNSTETGDVLNDGNSAPKATAFECYYYSFTTLTTLGYGDIVPVARYARILAIFEAVVGPVYLAIFVAQIIGMNIAQKMKN
ncbi:MAG: potassium channel family protein [Planctomycetota bacterium]|jgi:hypothetical protein